MGSELASNLVAADVGNSAIKLGLFRLEPRGVTGGIAEGPDAGMVESIPLLVPRVSGAASAEFSEETPDGRGENEHAAPQQLVRWFERLGDGPRWWFAASVNRAADTLLARWIREYRPQDCYTLLAYQHFPLPLAVAAAGRVGSDRLAAALAANHLRDKSRPAVVVDVGTAITVDAISGSGVFEGGAILPGVGTAAIALEQLTAALPPVDVRIASGAGEVIGRSTEAAIRSGIVWGSAGAVDMLVRRMTMSLGSLPEIFATGGDARLLLELLDFPVRFLPHLVLQGIALAGSIQPARPGDKRAR